MKTIRFPDGAAVPALGQGSWTMAEDARRRRDEIAALREGVGRGLTLIDTVEMSADGGAETLVGENAEAADLTLSAADLGRLDALFPRPSGRVPLQTL